MRSMLISAAFLAPSVAAADGISVSVENFFIQYGRANVVMKVSNETGLTYSDVFVDCTFLDEKQKAIDIGKEHLTTLYPGSSKYGKASIASQGREKFVSCIAAQVDR